MMSLIEPASSSGLRSISAFSGIPSRASARGPAALVEAARVDASAADGTHDADVLYRVAQQVGAVADRAAHKLLEFIVVGRVQLEALAFTRSDGEPFARQQLPVAHELIEL